VLATALTWRVISFKALLILWLTGVRECSRIVISDLVVLSAFRVRAHTIIRVLESDS
jgi:hypothetical protein